MIWAQPRLAAPARVMICDDSAVARAAIGRILRRDPQISVLAEASDGAEAVAALSPGAFDVVVLDLDMPVMGGLAALPLLLRGDPRLRVVVASGRSARSGADALAAMRLGAADYLLKPGVGEDAGFASELVARVKGLARLRRAASEPVPPARRPAQGARPAPLLLAIGSSTGGPQALFALVRALGPALPVPVVLTQHMPATFIPTLAAHIDRLGVLPAAVARHEEALRPGHIHIAPGDRHLLIATDGAALRAVLSDAPPVNHCRPAVDPMLSSAAEACGGRVLVVMLTGMGRDGLAGTGRVVALGGAAIAQDAATSVVWGMPGAIVRAGLAETVLPLPQIGAHVRALLGCPP